MSNRTTGERLLASYRKTETLLRNALEEKPDCPDLLAQLGLAARHARRTEEDVLAERLSGRTSLQVAAKVAELLAVVRLGVALIEQALAESGGVIKETMERLGLPRKTLYDKMQKYGLDKRRYR